MAIFFGYAPTPTTKKVTSNFENKVIIRRNNQSLVGRVFVDITDDEWKLAIGFNQMAISKLHGKENDFEVLYRYHPDERSNIIRLGTDTGFENNYTDRPFVSPDEFIIWGIGQEKEIQLSPA